ncbi:hypothetical protein G4B88_019475 [Cannabis sativa]|uniref:Uncharacterized protein n=1 Tax=Cannabis sativa TaxID=3483 RepID=A0A7J6HYP1_CANSA|nr:hypothetical protein G4B88_019475 [Cannabis sativa]
MTAFILSCSTSLQAACSKAKPANVGGLFKTKGYPLLVLLITSESSGITPSKAKPNISCTSNTDIISSPLIISVRTRFTIILISLIPSHSNSPVTLSASLKLVISGVVTRIASFAGVMAVIKPASMPAGQSMIMKSGQPSWRDFNAFPTKPHWQFRPRLRNAKQLEVGPPLIPHQSLVQPTIAIENLNDGVIDAILESEEEIEVAEANIGVYGNYGEAKSGEGETHIGGGGGLANAAFSRGDDDDSGCVAGQLGLPIPLKNGAYGGGFRGFGMVEKGGWVSGGGDGVVMVGMNGSKFENAWIGEPMCEQIIRDTWTSSPHLDLQAKLNRCGQLLQQWGSEITGNFSSRIKACKANLKNLKRRLAVLLSRSLDEAVGLFCTPVIKFSKKPDATSDVSKSGMSSPGTWDEAAGVTETSELLRAVCSAMKLRQRRAPPVRLTALIPSLKTRVNREKKECRK